VKDGNSCQISSIQVVLLSAATSCSKYPVKRFSPSSHLPARGGTIPKILLIRVVLPIPFAPVRATFLPRSKLKLRG